MTPSAGDRWRLRFAAGSGIVGGAVDQIDPASRELAGTALATVAPFAVLSAAARDELVGQSRTSRQPPAC